MTTTLGSGTLAEDRLPAAPPTYRDDHRRRRAGGVLACVLPPIGAVLIVLSHHHAAGLAEPDNAQFVLYWAGAFAGMLSLAGLACARDTGGVTRACALAGIGLFGMIPRLLHHRPAGGDEFIHLRQATEAYLHGEVGHSVTMLPITEEFFGLHQATSAVARLTGLPLWTAGTTVVVLAHVLSVLAVYQLIRMVGAPAQGAAIGAVMYTLNPSWMYFNVAFSYESLALPLLLWCLAGVVGAARATQSPPWRAMAVAGIAVAALPVIHHLSTIMLLLILTTLIGFRLVTWFPAAAAGGVLTDMRRGRVWPLAMIWAWLLVSIHIWWSENYRWLVDYLGPALSEGFTQLRSMFDGLGKSSGQRILFGNAANPVYEILAGYLFPFVALAVFLWSFTVLWHNRRHFGSTLWTFTVVGAMFFASMPMVLTTGGAEGAHRSWGYSFIGIAVVCGVAWNLAPHTGGMIAARWPSLAERLRRPTVRIGAAVSVFLVLSLGGAALGVNVSHRFPGSANVGDDARSVSHEGEAVAQWLAANAPIDSPVFTDRYVSLQVGSLGRMAPLSPSEEFPIWEIYMSDEPVRAEVLKQIWDSEIDYFVTDARMATVRPKMGFWFVRNEPGVGGRDPFPQAALDRFDCLPWLRAVYAAGPLTVYQVNRDILRSTEAGSCQESVP